MDCIPHVCEDKQRRRGMAPPHQQKRLEFLPTILLSSDSTAQEDHQHPHPAKDNQRRKTTEKPKKDYTTTAMPQ